MTRTARPLLLILLALAAAAPSPPPAAGAGPYQNAKAGFKILPPSDWTSKSTGGHLVMLSDKSYQAFIFIDLVVSPDAVFIDGEFKAFVDKKNDEVKKRVPSYKIVNNRPTDVGHLPGFVTEATYQAGPETMVMSVFYVLSGKKIFILTAICSQETAGVWRDQLLRSINTFGLLP
jgi:hypothetical protein